jgi:beta-galactosidase
MDTTGVMKDSAYYLKAAWTAAPMVHLLPHWNWPGREGQPIDVRVYANTDEVELLLNGRSLGRKPLQRHGHLEWSVPYAPGELTARGYKAGQLVASETVATTGQGSALRLAADRPQLRADGSDVAVVSVTVVDREGRVVPTAQDRIRFEVDGAARLIGMGNGDPGSHESDKPAELHRYAGAGSWRHKAVARPQDTAALLSDAGSEGWRDPFAWTPPEQQRVDGAWNVVQAVFARPAAAAGDRAVLFVGEAAAGQQLFLNGRAVTPRREEGMAAIDLDPAQLADRNTLAIVFATPAGGTRRLFDEAQSGRRWFTLRTTTPAAPWQRSVFNGHAQVILQSTGRAGRATLRALGDGLEAATLTVETLP